MKIISNLKYDRNKHGSFHVNSGEIVVEPDADLSVREIYNRFRNGEPLGVNLYDPYYSDNEYSDIDLSLLDLAEVDELLQQYNQIMKKHVKKYGDVDSNMNKDKVLDDDKVSEVTPKG